MSKGIRQFAIATFVQSLPMLADKGPTAFRKSVIADVAMAFEISIGSASTHYNHAFKVQKELAPESVVGLGRPEGKNNGGRKAKVVATEIATHIGAQGTIAGTETTGEEEAEETVVELAAEAVDPVAEVTAMVDVIKVKTGEVVARAVTVDTAQLLITKAAAGKKAKLVIAEAVAA